MFVLSPQQAAPVTDGYLRPLPGGFSLYINASAERLRMVRALAARTLREAGADAETRENVLLVASELIGNCVRVCGDGVPVVIDIEAGPAGVWVRVHDPEADRPPQPANVAPDDPEAESGRGLGLVDLLAPGWRVVATPLGKQIVCHLPYAPGGRRV